MPGSTAPAPAVGVHALWDAAEVRWATIALGLFLAALAGRAAGLDALSDACFAGCYVTGGWEPGWAGLRALRRRRLDVDLLMVVAAVVAAAIGQVLDGGLLIVIFSTSGALEGLATRRTRDAVQCLLTMAPDQVSRVGSDGAEQRVEAQTLAIGDVVVVRPGERIGADGTVLAGASADFHNREMTAISSTGWGDVPGHPVT